MQATPVREADAACAQCHAKIFRDYLATPMGNASGSAAEKLKPATFFHQSSGVTYTLSTEKAAAALAAQDARSGERMNWPLSYFLGSGHLGITYLYFIDSYLFESPVAWYAASGKYDMKPGFGQLTQMPPAIPVESACLRCHMSAVQRSLPGSINRYEGLPFLHTGITCEMCHGDSAEHVRSGGKASALNPARLDAERRDSVCISCHLEGDVSVERAGRSSLNFRPGEAISTYLAYYIRGGPSLTARGVSEVEQLSQSMCKRVSGDKMSCMSCHDPHFTPEPKQRSSFYRGKCLACHAQPEFAASHHKENPDCTSCHMPRTGAENIPHVAWTDHRILRVADGPPAHPSGAEKGELTAVFSPTADARDLAMAYYRLLLDGDRSMERPAWERLSQLNGAIGSDREALDALGNLSAGRGDLLSAAKAFRHALELDPGDSTALSNLGILEARQGNLEEAIRLLQKAFENNKDLPGMAINLARVDCAVGDSAAALVALKAALVYSPDLEDLRRVELEMSGPKSDCAVAAKAK